MVFDRPQRPGKPQPPANPTARPDQSAKPTKKVISTKASGGNADQGRGGGQPGGNGGRRNPPPSPWLQHPLDPLPQPAASASFVEYLRWMRSPEEQYKNETKVELLSQATENANYGARLKQLTDRTQLIAGAENCFPVQCTWRIRVGGHRGPERILLPAFDALGMPYIPSSTLRGAARTVAIRQFMAEGMSWQAASQAIAPYFGSLEADSGDRTGKVIFLDAYPLPTPTSQSGGLAMDMANNIWSWQAESLQYSPNPNSFLSLDQATFLIGIRPSTNCSAACLAQVRQWLIAGLAAGVGSQINTGYGELQRAGQSTGIKAEPPFLSIDFSLEGQLIHGYQQFTQWTWNHKHNKWQMQGRAVAEVRSTAFKSMLRYWFRTFARGVLPTAIEREWEANLFGSTTLKRWGLVTVQVVQGQVVQPEAKNKGDDPGEQVGTLRLSYSAKATLADRTAIASLLKNLTWLMFHLGGIGQGARRPCYSRQTRQHAPWWRGSRLTPESDDDFWALPNTIDSFQRLFQQRLRAFYQALTELTQHPINEQVPLALDRSRNDHWTEAVDSQCRIVVCAGQAIYQKPFALAVLHDPQFKQGQYYDGNLCGQIGSKKVKPSPVWIADFEDYQVVTVFGATVEPRQQYLRALRDHPSSRGYAQIFPFP